MRIEVRFESEVAIKLIELTIPLRTISRSSMIEAEINIHTLKGNCVVFYSRQVAIDVTVFNVE